MGFVKTASEVEEIQQMLNRPRYTVEALTLPFTTSPEFVESVLPPGLKSTGSGAATASVARWQSRKLGEFTSGAVSVEAVTEDGTVGFYDVSLFMTGDMAVSLGRECWGEVKKRAELGLFLDEHNAYGYAERNGVRLIEIEASIDTVIEPDEQSSCSLQLKAFPHATGIGLEYDPLLLVLDFHEERSTVLQGEATLVLKGTPYDPLDTVPVVSVGQAQYSVSRTLIEARAPLSLPGARSDYLPYVLGRHYDDFRLHRVGSGIYGE